MREKRYHLHKGELRPKFRKPRKEKKQRKKEQQKVIDNYFNRLKSLHGEDWVNWVICGG